MIPDFNFDAFEDSYSEALRKLENKAGEYQKKVIPRRLQRYHKDAVNNLRYINGQQSHLNHLTEQSNILSSDHSIGKILQDIEMTASEIKRLEFVERYLLESIKIEQARTLLKNSYDKNELENGLDGFEVLAKYDGNLESIKSRAKEILDEFRQKYEDRLLSEFKDAMEACKWPTAIDPSEWDSPAVTKLVTAAHDWTRFHLGDMRELMKVLVEPIKIRFGFHFESDRPTNRADKPEWLFSHLLKVASEHSQFFASYLQQMIASQEALLDIFLANLVELARNRLTDLKPIIGADGFMISHTIEEAVKFHHCLWDDYGFEDGQSCVKVFTDDKECLRFWVSNEKEALNKSFKSIADEHTVWVSDSKSGVDPFIYEVISLFNSVTTIYEGIEDDKVRIRFLLDLQIPLIESLYSSMEFGLPAFHSTSDDILITLAIANSAQVFLRVLREDWSQNLMFIELGLSDEFASHSLSSNIFSKSIHAFGDTLLYGAVFGNIHAFVWDQFSSHANSYARSMHYGLSIDDEEELLPHPELEKSLITLNAAFDILRQNNLEESLLLEIQNRIIRSVGDFFFSKVVLKNYFHQRGTIAFKHDLEATILRLEAIAPNIHPEFIKKELSKTFDAVKILELPPRIATELTSALISNNFAQVSSILKSLPISHLSMPECAEILKLKK